MISNDRNLMAAIIAAGYAARDSMLSAEEVVRRSFEVADAIIGTDHPNVPEVPEVPEVPRGVWIERIPTDPIPDVSEIEKIRFGDGIELCDANGWDCASWNHTYNPPRPDLCITHYKLKPKS